MIRQSDQDLLEQGEIKYLELAEKILTALKAYGAPMTSNEVAAEIFEDAAAVSLALNDLELGLPVIRFPVGRNGIMYCFKKPV